MNVVPDLKCRGWSPAATATGDPRRWLRVGMYLYVLKRSDRHDPTGWAEDRVTLWLAPS